MQRLPEHNDMVSSSQVKVKSDLKLFPWQKQVVNTLQTHWKGYIHVVKSKRQCGKSKLLELILIKTAIEMSRTTSILLSPTFDQARKIFREVKDVLQPTKIYARHNDLQLYIKLKNGSYIYFKSAEQKENLRGFTVTGIYCIDEAAYIDDDVIYNTLPYVNVSQSPILICSTPYHKTGNFYKYYTLGLSNDNPNIYSYDWSEFDTSALLPNEVLEEYRKQLPAAKFKTEFLGEFLDMEGSVFGNYDSVVSDNFEPNRNLYMGIDWGSGVGGDETAVCLFNDKKQMVALYHFNDKDETATINYIIELMKKHQPLKCKVETNSIGQVFYGLLQKAIIAAGLPVMLLRFNTTNESKEKLINKFQVAIQNNDVQILDMNSLKVELDMYECKVNNHGKHIYNAASGYHDDMIISMLLAYDCITSGYYCVR